MAETTVPHKERLSGETLSWHAQSIEHVLAALGATQSGLSEGEAEHRLKRFGSNTLPELPRATGLRIFLRQLQSPFTIILSIAAVISWALHDLLDALFIFAAVAINLIFGFFQEWRAERALEALQRIIRHDATVVRGSAPRRIPAELVVPGDILLLAAGERVPADARLFDVESLEVNEAALTGESLAVTKISDPVPIGSALADRRNMVYSGTAVTRGEGTAAVIATGTITEVGRIASAIREIPDEETPLEERLRLLARSITTVVLLLAAAVFLFGFRAGLPVLEIFTTAAAVAVAAVPEGLVVAVTMILAIGMSRLVRKRALVRRLRAAETLGSVTVICVDKTGTITEGRMRVADVLPASANEADREHLLHVAALANEAWLEESPESDGHTTGEVVGEPTDVAILQAALEAGLHDEIDARRTTVRDRLPFSSENQFIAALTELRERDTVIIAVKGAAEKLLPHAVRVRREGHGVPLAPAERGALTRKHNELSERGLRIIAVAERTVAPATAELPSAKDLLAELTFLGFIALHDPIREGVAHDIAAARAAGIKVVLITGDHVLTARTVAKSIGISADHVIDGEELATLSDEALGEQLRGNVIFARTAPQQKLRIVEALKRRGEIVAMTGDGINDAPALKSAAVGVSLGSGTDVAKESAELVLLDDDLSTIVAAVREGRVIFDNIRKVVVFLLIDTFSEIILILGSLLLGLPLALVATQILFVNLVEDGPPTFSLAFEPGERGIMQRPPRSPAEPILNREALLLIFGVGLLTDLLLLGVYAWLLHSGTDVATARTIVFAAVGLDSFVQIFALRNLREPFWRTNPFENPWLNGAVVIGISGVVMGILAPPLQTFLRTVPLEASAWLLVIGLSLFAVIPVEIIKFLVRRVPALQR
ncbi:MAG: HAD-IC family P-type ATPase [Candidatus Terrybacteria bacterium]|nr:HAD-IC family P-type ATPase [Candidatus Terrybacteria bacterium]